MNSAQGAAVVVRAKIPVAVPWYMWCTTVAVTLAILGVHWDISWHRSVGRDTFWTPAHLAIHLCALLAGITCGTLICRTTFDPHAPLRNSSVTVLGFRGPLGAFIVAWGGVAMLTSAPFDNWWHNAYGLDAKVFSIPHLVLAIGMIAIVLGSLILTWTEMNRAAGAKLQKLECIFLYVSGVLLGAATTPANALLVFAGEDSFVVLMHSAIFYRLLAIGLPLVLTVVYRVLSPFHNAQAQRRRWVTTSMAAAYTAVWLAFDWLLPLFPAQPKLGPIYRHTGHFLPVDFPLLIIVPAVALDWLWPKLVRYSDWRQALIGGTTFLVLLVAVQWPFASFLFSRGAQNWFFGGNELSPFLAPDTYTVRRLFLSWEPSRHVFWFGMAAAWVSTVLSMRLGLAGGNWMRELKR